MGAREQDCIRAFGGIPAGEAAPPSAAVRRYRIEALSDAAALAALKPAWDALQAEAAVDHPFLSHEWISIWWDCFGSGRRLRILLVMDGARLAGIAPLLHADRKIYGIRVRCLAALYNPHTPRFDFIVAPHEAADVCRGIWDYLREAADWDLLEFSQLPAGSPVLAALPQLARNDGFPTGLWHGEQSPYVPFGGDFEAYFSRLGCSHRSEVRRRLKRLRERGEVRLEVVTAAEQVERALDDGFRLEAVGLKSHAGTAMNSAAEVASFYREFARHAADTGMLRLLFLTLNGVRIAFSYGLSYRNRLYVLKTGYDPEYSYYSPYNLLCYLVFQDGFARGLEGYDFLGNGDAWKLVWSKATRQHDWLYVFAPSLRAHLVRLIKFRCIPLLRSWRGLRVLLPAGGRGNRGPAMRDGEGLSSGHE